MKTECQCRINVRIYFWAPPSISGSQITGSHCLDSPTSGKSLSVLSLPFFCKPCCTTYTTLTPHRGRWDSGEWTPSYPLFRQSLWVFHFCLSFGPSIPIQPNSRRLFSSRYIHIFIIPFSYFFLLFSLPASSAAFSSSFFLSFSSFFFHLVRHLHWKFLKKISERHPWCTHTYK